MSKLWTSLQGKKIYIGAVGLVVAGLYNLLQGQIDLQHLVTDYVWWAWLLIGGKSALAKLEPTK